MPLWIVVGGQYGSEGKGKLVSYLSLREHAAAVVRTGGPNAGHTVDFEGKRHTSRQLPSGYINPGTMLVIGAGGMVDVPLLAAEIEKLNGMGYDVASRLKIDPMAAVVPANSSVAELELGMQDRFGSTQTGTGYATAMKVLRDDKRLTLAKDSQSLKGFICDTKAYLNELLGNHQMVIIEGTQGYGLSLHHSGHWPFCTSRDTTAAGFLSEVGLSPFDVAEIAVVFRTFPIRVGGNSGPMFKETTWDKVLTDAGFPAEERAPEITSVTRRIRRVGSWDPCLARAACLANKPTHIALHGIDYINYADRGETAYRELSEKSGQFIAKISGDIDVCPNFLFTGPRNEDLVDLTSDAEEGEC